jgi:basic amino acid/polyamine antiporter, APA family
VARLSEHGLRRSIGMSGLFATAYGNLGSSIYYALGLVAAHALGLTPLVFMFAAGLFVLTAKTYSERAGHRPDRLIPAPRIVIETDSTAPAPPLALA